MKITMKIDAYKIDESTSVYADTVFRVSDKAFIAKVILTGEWQLFAVTNGGNIGLYEDDSYSNYCFIKTIGNGDFMEGADVLDKEIVPFLLRMCDIPGTRNKRLEEAVDFIETKVNETKDLFTAETSKHTENGMTVVMTTRFNSEWTFNEYEDTQGRKYLVAFREDTERGWGLVTPEGNIDSVDCHGVFEDERMFFMNDRELEEIEIFLHRLEL